MGFLGYRRINTARALYYERYTYAIDVSTRFTSISSPRRFSNNCVVFCYAVGHPEFDARLLGNDIADA